MLFIFLTGCFYKKEAKKLKNNPAIQHDIQTAIEELVKFEYGLEVDVNLRKLRFTTPEGKLMFPIKTSKRLEVPVDIRGEPSYQFKAYISIYNEDQDEYVFDKDESDIDVRGMGNFGTHVMNHIFYEMNERALDKIKQFEPDSVVNVRVEHDFYNKAFDDEVERRERLAEFADDYNDGKFTNEAYYEEMYNKYAEKPNEHMIAYDELIKGNTPCTTGITLDVEHNEDREDTISDRLQHIVTFIQSERDMPNGMYRVYVNDVSTNKNYEKDDESDHFYICE